MDAFQAKLVAAATGSTLTALTSASPSSFGLLRTQLTVCSDSFRPGEDQVADPTRSDTSAVSSTSN